MRKRNKNELLRQVRVEDYAAEGKSLSKLDGKVIFIEDAIPGDLVDVRLSKNKKDYAEGRAVNFHEFSPDRIDPFCRHFGICGGCQWQMLPYEKQLLYKQSQVRETLKRIGKIPLPEMEFILGADQTRYYRNKIEYTFGNKRYLLPAELGNHTINSKQDVAGFHAQGIFDKVVDIDTCHLQSEPTNKIRKAIKDFGIKNGYSFYDAREHRGFLRTIQLRMCRTGEIMVNIVLGHENERDRKLLLDHLLKEFPAITTLLYTINEKRNDSLNDLQPQVYAGKGYITETLEAFRFKIGPKSFFQTNTMQAERLYQVTREFAGLTGKEIVYDLYCGTGSIGIFLSTGAAKIIGVDLIPEAIEDARENAALNGIHHAAFYTGDVSAVCNDEFFDQNGKPDVIITDPPRAGMHVDLIKNILTMKAPVIAYVSCNPATQARDIALLSDQYKVDRIRPVDMFPHTHHIENVVRMVLK